VVGSVTSVSAIAGTREGPSGADVLKQIVQNQVAAKGI